MDYGIPPIDATPARVDPAVAHRAAIHICDIHLADPAGALEMLQALGLAPYQSGQRPRGEQR